ncbi:hypothetical protein EYF80_020407 [Liparis tanakae]|uniref:Uncharacterized protein n=1 Tax=Liparis tanakae TaxID=230148 RepID=A0A4Z2HU90_9TELE|nr:hypothetical protein EYF80_020407 [Liparis tanakae]
MQKDFKKDLQGLEVRQALVVVKQNAVVSCGCADWLVAQTGPLFLFGFLQHLREKDITEEPSHNKRAKSSRCRECTQRATQVGLSDRGRTAGRGSTCLTQRYRLLHQGLGLSETRNPVPPTSTSSSAASGSGSRLTGWSQMITCPPAAGSGWSVRPSEVSSAPVPSAPVPSAPVPSVADCGRSRLSGIKGDCSGAGGGAKAAGTSGQGPGSVCRGMSAEEGSTSAWDMFVWAKESYKAQRRFCVRESDSAAHPFGASQPLFFRPATSARR